MIWSVRRNYSLEDKAALPKARMGYRWRPQGGWDNGRPLEAVGAAFEMTDLIANDKNPRACGWVTKQGKDGSIKHVLVEPEVPYGDYKGRYNDFKSSRA